MSRAMDSEVYSAGEIARAARVPRRLIADVLESRHVELVKGFVRHQDAVALVRVLSRRASNQGTAAAREPLTLARQPRRRGGLSLVASGAAHALFVALLVAVTSIHLFGRDTTDVAVQDAPVHLVFLMEAGPGGGGGGGGTEVPVPPPPAQRKTPAPEIKKVSSPVPPVRNLLHTPTPVIAPPPPPPAIVESPKPDPPPPTPTPQVVAAPVAPAPADAQDLAGALSAPPSASTSNGPGRSGGIGNGAGTGLGEGDGAGIGPGSGGGTGGGPFQPGSGILPPTLVREVKASYTDEARRRTLEGDVVLEIVVKRDGSVGAMRVVRALGGGLDQKAMDAVRQWRFGPATRNGAPVDVFVEVSVGFTLR